MKPNAFILVASLFVSAVLLIGPLLTTGCKDSVADEITSEATLELPEHMGSLEDEALAILPLLTRPPITDAERELTSRLVLSWLHFQIRPETPNPDLGGCWIWWEWRRGHREKRPLPAEILCSHMADIAEASRKGFAARLNQLCNDLVAFEIPASNYQVSPLYTLDSSALERYVVNGKFDLSRLWAEISNAAEGMKGVDLDNTTLKRQAEPAVYECCTKWLRRERTPSCFDGLIVAERAKIVLTAGSSSEVQLAIDSELRCRRRSSKTWIRLELGQSVVSSEATENGGAPVGVLADKGCSLDAELMDVVLKSVLSKKAYEGLMRPSDENR